MRTRINCHFVIFPRMDGEDTTGIQLPKVHFSLRNVGECCGHLSTFPYAAAHVVLELDWNRCSPLYDRKNIYGHTPFLGTGRGREKILNRRYEWGGRWVRTPLSCGRSTVLQLHHLFLLFGRGREKSRWRGSLIKVWVNLRKKEVENCSLSSNASCLPSLSYQAKKRVWMKDLLLLLLLLLQRNPNVGFSFRTLH